MHNKNVIGIGFKLLNGLCFAIMSFLIFSCSNDASAAQVLFVRSLLGCIICFGALKLIKQDIPLFLPKKRTLFYIARASINVIAMLVWIEALKTLGMNEATAVSYSAPVWTLFFGYFVFNEKFDKKSITVLILNVIGMLIILQPNISNATYYGVIIAMSSSFLWACYDTICKKQGSTEHYLLQAFYTFACCTLILSPFVLNTWRPMSVQTWGLLGALSAIGVLNIVSLFLAYKYATMTLLAPFSYSRLIFTILLSLLLNKAIPGNDYMFGVIIILCSNVYLWWTQSFIKDN